MRLLVVTTRYPTPDRPAAGAFVRDRVLDPALQSRVVAPHRYDGSRVVRFLRLAWDAGTARGRFDGVEGHFVLPAGPIALLAARLRRVPLVVYAHGSDVRELADRSPVHRWLARRVIRGAAAVATNSPATSEHVRHLGREASVIPPGIDLQRFTPSARPDGRNRVLYVGGADPGKGVQHARRLADTLVGPGLREISPADMPALMAEHDVLLVPSADEGFGVAAAEATAAGRWVVATAAGGLRETVRDGLTGTLVDDDDYEGALARVPDYDPWRVAEHAARFDVANHRAEMDRLWRDVLGRQPARRPTAPRQSR